MFDSVECFREVDRADVQRNTPLSTTLLQDCVHHKVIVTFMIGPKPRLIGKLYTVQRKSESSVKYGGKQLVKYWQTTNWSVIACIFSVTFFVNDLDSNISPVFWCEVILLRSFVEDYPDFSFVSSLQFLSCSARIPLLSCAFTFFHRSMAS